MVGEWDTEKLADSMPSRIFYEWQAYNRLSPIGAWRGDWQAAMIAAVIANSRRGKNGRRYRVNDFMPKWAKPTTKTQTPQEFYQSLKRHLGFYGTTRPGNPDSPAQNG